MQSHPVPMPRDIQEKDLNRDLEVCLDNLLFADERKAALLSQYRAVQAELAEKWLDTLLLRSGNARGEELLELLLISYRTLLDERKVSVTDTNEILLPFCLSLSEALRRRKILLLPLLLGMTGHAHDGEDEEKQIGSVSLLPGHMQTQMFEHMLPKSCRILSSQSYEECCENVAGGTTDACILPLQDRNGGRLCSFYRLLTQHGLVIRKKAIWTFEEDDVQCALACKHPDPTVTRRAPYWIDLLIPCPAGTPPMPFLLALTACRVQLESISSDTDPQTEEISYYLTLRCDTESLTQALFLFARMQDISFRLTGLYKDTPSKED